METYCDPSSADSLLKAVVCRDSLDFRPFPKLGRVLFTRPTDWFRPYNGDILWNPRIEPQLTVLSVANAGPRLPLDAPILPPATRVIHLDNLQRLYLEQEDPCDIGWMLIHLKIPTSTNVRIFADLDYSGQSAALFELVFDLVLPDHFGFPHLTNLHRCTYGVHLRPTCIITANNLTFSITWKDNIRTHFNFMMPFLRRAMATGVIEDLTIIHDFPRKHRHITLRWDQILGTLYSLQKLRVEQSPANLDFSIWTLFESPPSPSLRELWLSFLVFGKEMLEEKEGGGRKDLVERLVNYCAKRDQNGYRLERLVIEAPGDPPPDLASLLAPYVDHFEIREEVSNDEDIWDLESASRTMFHFPQAYR